MFLENGIISLSYLFLPLILTNIKTAREILIDIHVTETDFEEVTPNGKPSHGAGVEIFRKLHFDIFPLGPLQFVRSEGTDKFLERILDDFPRVQRSVLAAVKNGRRTLK